MEGHIEKQPSFNIALPKIGDEVQLSPMHIKAWKETYVGTESGLTEEMVDELLGHMLTNYDRRRNTITESLEHPDQVFYRVVKNARGEIVGFVHGSKNDATNELEAIYLLNEAKGAGAGGKLMEAFLAWADKDKQTRLEAFTFNHHALGFYTNYGFVRTDKPVALWKDRLPYIEMVRPPDESVRD